MSTPVELLCPAAGGGGTNHEATPTPFPLLRAARGGDLALVQRLLREGGASIEEADSNGDTALLIASFNGHLPVVQWLLREGGASKED